MDRLMKQVAEASSNTSQSAITLHDGHTVPSAQKLHQRPSTGRAYSTVGQPPLVPLVPCPAKPDDFVGPCIAVDMGHGQAHQVPHLTLL